LVNSISISGIDAGYGAVRVLEGVSLSVPNGETVALLGTNGNGKSTLIRCILGIIKPTRGTIVAEIEGRTYDLTQMATEDIVDLGIGVVPESRRLFPKLTVEENLRLGAFRSSARVNLKKNLEFCYECFPRLAERKSQTAGSMSGGEQQMVALGRALMVGPKILLVDEPSVGLAPILVARTVLMAEQNFAQAMRIANIGHVLVHGKIVFSGTATQLGDNDLVKKLYLGI
jgi:branched-chain amino acid transport system ATP-binding protein